MKFSKRFFSILLSILVFLLIVSGCSSKNQDISLESRDSSYETEDGFSGSVSEEVVEEEDSVSNSSSLEPTKLVVRHFLNIQTIEFNKAISSLESLIDENEAYVENSNVYLGDYYNQSNYKTAEYVIRVPKDNVARFLSKTDSIGKITSQEENKEDLTMQYRDTESRLNVLEVKEERILGLLKKAEKMEDIISLENSLSDIIYEKENLTGVLKDIDNRVDHSTITINLEEVRKIDLEDSDQVSFGKRLTNALTNSLSSFKISLENFIIQLIYVLPFLLVLSLVGFGGYKGFKHLNKKREKSVDQDDK